MEPLYDPHMYDNIDNFTIATEDFDSLLSSNNSIIMDVSRSGAQNNSRLLSILNNENSNNGNTTSEESVTNNDELFFPSNPSLILRTSPPAVPRAVGRYNYPTDMKNSSSPSFSIFRSNRSPTKENNIVSPKRYLSAVSPTIRKIYSPSSSKNDIKATTMINKQNNNGVSLSSPFASNVHHHQQSVSSSPLRNGNNEASSPLQITHRKPQRVLTPYGQKVLAQRSQDISNNTNTVDTTTDSYFVNPSTYKQGKTVVPADTNDEAINTESSKTKGTTKVAQPRVSFEYEYDVSGPLELDSNYLSINYFTNMTTIPSNIQQMVHNPSGWMIPRTSPFSPSAQLPTNTNDENKESLNFPPSSTFAIPFSLNNLSTNSLSTTESISSLATGSTRTLPVADVPEISIRRIEGPHYTLPTVTTEDPKVSKGGKEQVSTKRSPTKHNINLSSPSKGNIRTSPRAFRTVKGNGNMNSAQVLNTTVNTTTNVPSSSHGHVEYRVSTVFGRATVKRVIVSPSQSKKNSSPYSSPLKTVLSPLASNRISHGTTIYEAKEHLLNPIFATALMNDTNVSGGTVPEVEEIYRTYQEQVQQQQDSEPQYIETPMVVHTRSPTKVSVTDTESPEQIVSAVNEEIDFDALYEMEYGKSLSPRNGNYEIDDSKINSNNIALNLSRVSVNRPTAVEADQSFALEKHFADVNTTATSFINPTNETTGHYQPPPTVTERISRYRPTGKADPVTLYKQLILNNDINKDGLHTKTTHRPETMFSGISRTPSPRSKTLKKQSKKVSPSNATISSTNTMKSPNFDLLDDETGTENNEVLDSFQEDNNNQDTASRYRLLVALLNMAGIQNPPVRGEPGYADFARFLAFEDGNNKHMQQLLQQNLPNPPNNMVPPRYTVTNSRKTLTSKPVNATMAKKEKMMHTEPVITNESIATPSPPMAKKTTARRVLQATVVPPNVPSTATTYRKTGPISEKFSANTNMTKTPVPVQRPTTARSDALSSIDYNATPPHVTKQDHVFRSRFMRLH